jgi:endonuclease/exonuclease/phosphatase family metal-dependent hydrolase
MIMIRFGLLLIAAWTATTTLAGEPLRVVTYNIRFANPADGEDYWPNRVDAVSDFLRGFDLIGLQEVTSAQFEQLKERLKEFDCYGLGRDDGKSGGEHAAVFFRRERLEPIAQGTFWLSETPDQVGVKGWDAALPRTCTWLVLQQRGSDHRLWFANTHFDHRGSKARTESAKLIRRLTQQRRDGLPAIVLGDFNCRPGSEPYQALTDAAISDVRPLVDARAVTLQPPAGPNSTWNGFREIVADQIIDHIFVDGPLKVRTLEVLDPRTEAGRFASDHLPVAASIELE